MNSLRRCAIDQDDDTTTRVALLLPSSKKSAVECGRRTSWALAAACDRRVAERADHRDRRGGVDCVEDDDGSAILFVRAVDFSFPTATNACG